MKRNMARAEKPKDKNTDGIEPDRPYNSVVLPLPPGAGDVDLGEMRDKTKAMRTLAS